MVAYVKIAGTGRALPKQVISSEELDERFGYEQGHLYQLTGVAKRYFCDKENQIDLAVEASGRALKEAGISINQIDLVLGACSVPHQPIPATAPLVMQRLGLLDGQAAAYDVNATCLSFLTAFEVAANKISLGLCKVALVFSSEIASRALPWDAQPDVAALFGDGAAAAILVADEKQKSGIRACHFSTYPSAYEACGIGAGGTRFDYKNNKEEFDKNAVFQMQGKELFRITHLHFPNFVDQLLSQAGWSLDDVDIIVPHQASPAALEHMIRRTNINPERVINVATELGNQIAASIPTALDIALRSSKSTSASRILMLGTSAGVTFGGIAFEL